MPDYTARECFKPLSTATNLRLKNHIDFSLNMAKFDVNKTNAARLSINESPDKRVRMFLAGDCESGCSSEAAGNV
jgi:hypothetical protein